MADYLFFALERYAVPILQPLAAALDQQGHRTYAWFVEGAARSRMASPVVHVDLAGALALRPRAVFTVANRVPNFLGGAKVELFHGFNVEKRTSSRGHFRIRGMFDLYCTQGPATTVPFQQLARRCGHFHVVETGWPKLDPLFQPHDALADDLRSTAGGRPIVLFASTFTERLSAAPRLLAPIAAEVGRGDRYWLLTLHPKIHPDMVRRYRALAGPNARFIETEELVSAQRAADILVADTTSVVSEFVVQHKPVVTFRNQAPKRHMIDFNDPARLPEMLAAAFAPSEAQRQAIIDYADHIHPWRDGRSSQRVIAATEDLVTGRLGELKRKPLVAHWRELLLRQRLGYWGRRAAG